MLKCFLLFCYCAVGISLAQKSASDLCKKTYQEAAASSNFGKWSMINERHLNWSYQDTFTVVNRSSAIRGAAKLDTISIDLLFENDWSEKKMDAMRKSNSAILTPLTNKFVAALDSIEWKGVKLNKQTFLENNVLYLPYLTYITKITTDELATLNNLVRLPDFLIGSVGVFMNASPNHAYLYIKEIEIDNLYFTQLKFISKTLFKKEKVNLGIENYEK